MDERELRNRLAGIDPVSSGVEVRSVTDESSQVMLEKIMKQPVGETSGRMMQYLVGAAAGLVLVVGGFAVFAGGADPDVVATGETLELSLGEYDAMASCLAPSAESLRDVPLAFAGSATAVDGENVTLSVDEWFVGGDAANVSLFAPDGFEALLAGIDFEVGTSYLISAYDGVVAYCGLSGEATPELTAMYDEAFGG